jgi:SAM-dependent methyltransferase
LNCRHCLNELTYQWLDLGFAPPSNAYVSREQLSAPERYYPLRLFVCEKCWLVQTEDYAKANELFSGDYAYFSSISKSWLQHASDYCSQITHRLSLNESSFVIEVASNDGYLLKNMVSAKIPCLGIEPTDSTADAAESFGIPVLREFFGESLGKSLANQGKQADLIIANNVLAHVPDINDFVKGLKMALKPSGTITLEFPHLLQLIENSQFDTVYHEHYSYLSLGTVRQILSSVDLKVVDVDILQTHGGSLRVYACHKSVSREASTMVSRVLQEESLAGLQSLFGFEGFQRRAFAIKLDLLQFLVAQKKNGKQVVAYGAAAKGNTLLNYAGVNADLLTYVVDASVHKQGLFMPGSHIPIVDEKIIREKKPDFVLILPWNLKDEISTQLDYIKEWGGKFVISMPEMRIL